jgi:hypothetical protein
MDRVAKNVAYSTSICENREDVATNIYLKCHKCIEKSITFEKVILRFQQDAANQVTSLHVRIELHEKKRQTE